MLFLHGVLNHFFFNRLSFSHFPRCYSRQPEFMWWMRHASVLLKESRLRFHLRWINICAATWVISNCIMLVNVPGKIADELATRWRVTCPARKNCTAWRSPKECSRAVGCHLLSNRRCDRQGQKWSGWPCKATVLEGVVTQTSCTRDDVKTVN